ncbi:carboxymuconolactone decarboxylase family protein [Acinetobacter sp. 'aerobic (ED)']|uniref:carboxymuconolactone decarboxylase family protein n=1 Tax=Acinetobacter sp. 'aerobic (ED)' TaxID=174230 RepID=UPI00192AAA3B|nr:carboxymuconolactone decarboxylase family protein [Acinetobacter sp. 'aerobic (ED)']
MEDSLSQQQEAIIPIAAFAASGDMDNLNQALVHGLEQGLTINQIKAILVQSYAYVGFPRSLNALTIFMHLLEQRKAKGIIDAEGRNSQALPQDYQAKVQGTENQTQLVGRSVQGPLFEFAPEIDEYLKAHLFGDIFSRDVLSWQDREIATLGMLISMQGVDSQLQSHLGIARNQGVTARHLEQIERILTEKVNPEIGQRFKKANVIFQDQSR